MAEPDLAARLEPLIRRSFGSDAALAEVEALAGDASTRSYARARLRGPGAPATVVVMLLADRGIAMSSDELAVFAEPLRQLPYVNVHEFLIRIGVAVPELYLDASDEGVLLLEDVGSVTLWDAVQGRRDEEVGGALRARDRPAAAPPGERHRAARRRLHRLPAAVRRAALPVGVRALPRVGAGRSDRRAAPRFRDQPFCASALPPSPATSTDSRASSITATSTAGTSSSATDASA